MTFAANVTGKSSTATAAENSTENTATDPGWIRILLVAQATEKHANHDTHLWLYQPRQNVPAAGNFAAVSPFLAAYFTLDFTRSPLAGKGT